MAGSFGFEQEHYDLSRAIGSRRLFPAVQAKQQATNGDFDVVAAGRLLPSAGRALHRQTPEASGRGAGRSVVIRERPRHC